MKKLSEYVLDMKTAEDKDIDYLFSNELPEEKPPALPKEYYESQTDALLDNCASASTGYSNNLGIKFGKQYNSNAVKIKWHNVVTTTDRAILLDIIINANPLQIVQLWLPKAALSNMDEETHSVGVYKPFLKDRYPNVYAIYDEQ